MHEAAQDLAETLEAKNRVSSAKATLAEAEGHLVRVHYKYGRCHCDAIATHAEHWHHIIRRFCNACVPMSGHGERCPRPCRELHAEYLLGQTRK